MDHTGLPLQTTLYLPLPCERLRTSNVRQNVERSPERRMFARWRHLNDRHLIPILIQRADPKSNANDSSGFEHLVQGQRLWLKAKD